MDSSWTPGAWSRAPAPERIQLTARVFSRITGKPAEVTDDFVGAMAQQQRTVLLVVPEKASMND